MQDKFKQYITRHRLLSPGDRVLAAVSGGIDSMVMSDLLHSLGIDYSMAHCNFQLRGDESDGDECFITQKAAGLNIPIHVTRFDTSGFARSNGISIQMAARELRYKWFGELLEEYHYDHIAIAHNSDDRLETLWINMGRGTGIHGLTGIRPGNGRIIRPLLFASRKEITAYAELHQVTFREDSSNASDKYARNYIRHHLIPGMEKFFPGFRAIMDRNMDHFSGTEMIYNEAVENYKKLIVSHVGEQLHIDLAQLMRCPSPAALLFEIIHGSGFSHTSVTDILDQTQDRSGKKFLSRTHQIIFDRDKLIMYPLATGETAEYPVSGNDCNVDYPLSLSIEKFDICPGFEITHDPLTACLDAGMVCFPLTLRKWRPGDSFYPLGMNNSKKLSDFFIDQKLSLREKEQVWILESAGQIAWIIGHRIDNRYKVTGNTKKVIRITRNS